ncbi:MAG: bifunctional N(6)-L-threonylcarbamoyladenine synthase/serine/threonine protein kinase [Candidatus Aenigmarchaeota archaeon]|nr:bifunctional N(6)-L-threonylcarbamoyladenine synthase/serine/threonine protein kinase [Candidatus Aenigmarchaeota archaeon]MCK5321671.1 bifunctional N(6)-L-threonylcarbamoyladenine synthase/serine/threonine protein kinase [Candidatus Aenigmarchaeota archaeon]
MIIFGIESTAHTLGMGIMDSKGKCLTNTKRSFFVKKGIHPREAADHHADCIHELYDECLTSAKIQEKDIDLIAFSQGPGIMGCLKIGATFARTLSMKLNRPIIGINHCLAHISIGKLMTGAKDPLTVYVSGGNSQITALAGGKYRIFGETLDIGIGNMIDKFARELDLGFPGGPQIDKVMKDAKRYIPLPYTVKGMDFSFSGVLTEALRQIKTHKKPIPDVTFSLAENAYSMITEVAERGLSHTGKKELLLTGGVAASKMLRNKLEIMCKERGADFFAVPIEFAMDNGAMIAWQGYLEHKAGRRQEIKDTKVDTKWRTDHVDVFWE